MTPAAHVGATENDFGSPLWRATCSCGWEGMWTSEEGAGRELAEHYAATPTGPAPLPRTPTSLDNCLLCRKPRSRCCC